MFNITVLMEWIALTEEIALNLGEWREGFMYATALSWDLIL